jgi:hypothetical protein
MPLGAPLPGFIYATGLRFYKSPSRIQIRAFLLRLQVIFESLYLSTSIMGRTRYTNPWVPEGHIHVTRVQEFQLEREAPVISGHKQAKVLSAPKIFLDRRQPVPDFKLIKPPQQSFTAA